MIETAGSSPLRVEALAVLRTESGLDTDGVGYDVRVEQGLGFGSPVRIGGTVRSVVDPIEEAGVRDLEASLAAALFRLDTRDYFERTGWSAFARWTPIWSPIEAMVEYRDESHASLAARSPWSLFNGGDAWRPQPLVAEGKIRTIGAGIEYDTRDRKDRATRGWLLAARVDHGVGGKLAIPEHGSPILADADWVAVHPRQHVDTDFATARLEVRRYQRVGYAALLNVRAVLTGALTDSPLPPQFQHALGGIGTLPGYATMSADCGARSARVSREARPTTPFFAGYGCDRAFLVQAEYIGPFGLDIDFFNRDRARNRVRVQDPDDWWPSMIDFDPTWVVFVDAGRGWTLEDSAEPFRQDTELLVDAGVGLLFGDIGIYAAAPVRGEGRKVNVFLRLGRRF